MTSKEKVAIVKVTEQQIDKAVTQLVALLGDLDDIIPSGSRVMIKPNLVFPPTDRGITHPELVEAVVRKALYYYPSHRTLTRLGLAYAVDSATRHDYLLPEGIANVLQQA